MSIPLPFPPYFLMPSVPPPGECAPLPARHTRVGQASYQRGILHVAGTIILHGLLPDQDVFDILMPIADRLAAAGHTLTVAHGETLTRAQDGSWTWTFEA